MFAESANTFGVARWQKLEAVTTHDQPLEIGTSRIQVESMNTTHGEAEDIHGATVAIVDPILLYPLSLGIMLSGTPSRNSWPKQESEKIQPP